MSCNLNEYNFQVGLIDPGNYKKVVDLVTADKKSLGEVELLSVKVVEERGEIEIS